MKQSVIRSFCLNTSTIENKTSLKISPTGQIILENVKIPKENLLPNTSGWKSVYSCLNNARYGISWGVLGAANNCWKISKDYTENRIMFKKPLAANQLIQKKLAIMQTEISIACSACLHLGRAMDKGKDGDMTHVSIDWFSNDVDVMGDTFATKIRPTEVSFIDNKSMDPVCKECTIETECELHVNDDDHDCGCGGEHTACECEDGKTEVEIMSEETKETTVKSDAENIVEREFASLRTQLEEMAASKKEIESQYESAMKEIEAFKEAEDERAEKEAEARKATAVEAIISREV